MGRGYPAGRVLGAGFHCKEGVLGAWPHYPGGAWGRGNRAPLGRALEGEGMGGATLPGSMLGAGLHCRRGLLGAGLQAGAAPRSVEGRGGGAADSG